MSSETVRAVEYLTSFVQHMTGSGCFEDKFADEALHNIATGFQVAEAEIAALKEQLKNTQASAGNQIESYVIVTDSLKQERAKLQDQLSQVTKERDEYKITLDIINGWCHGNIDTGAEVAPFCIQVRDLIERSTDQEES